ncbi:uncharacterized protein BDR25DRAFT_229933 [Lindgomyces ingoldianus]|uniref:Uncharacterized protein n=1 Tax=Lindgomyces ingoldianus TaxID=673940 RepID=A0ACB6QQE7_9PLEO|nr:uncharacterized protein BDR25DRAFT_229933 [Lindgomyces ingoldianus]KAF2469141.1 hypothetical protein BDR25DRAFT_229933 [Lindgomyces ingoldianus]
MKRQVGVPQLTPEQIAYTNAPEILSITGSFFAAAALVVLLRCYVRIVMLKVFGIDDYVMVFSMILASATFACFVIETHYGLGKHFLVLLMDPIMYMNFARILYVHSIIVMVGVSSVKVSIAFFLMRLSTRTPYSRFLYGCIGFIILLTVTCAMTLIFQCLPVEAAWDSRLRPPPFGTGTAKCYSMTIFRNLGLMNSSFNIITDVLFATIPVPLIWKLQLNTRTKISLIAILSLGFFASAAAIIKAVQQWHVLSDPDWTVHDSFNVWNYIEFTIGIIAASLPALKPLFNWFLETARAITSGGRSKGSGYKASGYKGAGSLGYQKQASDSRSIALHSLTSKGDSTPGGYKNPYNVRVTTKGEKDTWDMERAKTSDESILPLQRPEPGSHQIVMTREVRVS